MDLREIFSGVRKTAFVLLGAVVVLCVAGRGEGLKDFERVGYYVFIGKGDYRDEFGPETHRFSLDDWKRLLDDLKSRGATTFIPLVTGHRLPYPSRAFPDYVESDAGTAKNVDLQEIIDYAKSRQLEVILAFTTTGHCNSFAKDHPEYCVIDQAGNPKNALCPNRKGSTQYPSAVVDEVLARFRNFDGILIHPPEIEPECFCPECRALYRRQSGRDYQTADPRERQRFFVQTYLRFARELFARVGRQIRLKTRLMFNCNWLDDHLDLMALVPADVGIIYWDYDLREEHLQGRFQENLERYAALGRTLWFMPSTVRRWWTPSDADLEWGCRQVIKQVKIASQHKIKNIGFFVGAYVQKETFELIFSGLGR